MKLPLADDTERANDGARAFAEWTYPPKSESEEGAVQPQVQISIGGIAGALAGMLVTWLMIKNGLIVDALRTCDSFPNANLRLVEQEGFGRYCGYTWAAIFAAGAVPISICSLAGVLVAKAFEEKH